MVMTSAVGRDTQNIDGQLNTRPLFYVLITVSIMNMAHQQEMSGNPAASSGCHMFEIRYLPRPEGDLPP